MTLGEAERSLLNEALAQALRPDGSDLLTKNAFRLAHEAQRKIIDALVGSNHLREERGRYSLTLEGLLACGSEESRARG